MHQINFLNPDDLPDPAHRCPIDAAAARDTNHMEATRLELTGYGIWECVSIFENANAGRMPALLEIVGKRGHDIFRAIETFAADQVQNLHWPPFSIASSAPFHPESRDHT